MPVPLNFRRLALTVLALLSLSARAATEGFYRQPAIQGQRLVVVAEGDLWTVALNGGPAQRLTTHPGFETLPAVSRDGQWLAFVGQYEGNSGSTVNGSGDVYVMPVAGGVPRRLTWEGSGIKVWGFSAQAEVIYTGPTLSGQPGSQLFAIDPKTALRRTLPVAQASDGALSDDGRTLYFTRMGLRSDNARQYRGGALARLWVMDLGSSAEARPLVAEGANDRRPMPYTAADGEARIAFLSDRDGTVNVWSVNAAGQDLRQHSHSKGWDIRHASVDGTKLAYAVGADIHLLDLSSNADTLVPIALSGDFDAQRERFIKRPQDYLVDTAFAPNGERVLLSSRGHLATTGAGPLRRAELPQPSDGRCRKGEFSADSNAVFALCDFGGEVEIWRFAANGTGKPEAITHGATALRQDLSASPDGRYLAHTDKEGHLFLTDLKAPSPSTATRLIDHNQAGGGHEALTWSPNSQALAFTRPVQGRERSQLQLYTVADGKTTQLTSDRYDNAAPAFTPDGRWLYFLSNRHFATTGSGAPWGDRNMGPYFDRRTRIYALALQPGQRFAFAARDELTPVEPEAKKDPKPVLPSIVSAGLAQRLFEVPLPPGNYSALRSDGKRLWFLETELGGAERKVNLMSLPLDNLGGKPELLSVDVQQFGLSADGKKLMIKRGPVNPTTPVAAEILLIDTAAKLPTELPRFQVRWSDWQISTDPRAEWRQIFADAWRMHRDYFYDKAMHGVDWLGVRRKYEPLLARVTDRAELGELLGLMASELGALHSQVGMPDLRAGTEDPALAGLGAQLVKQADGFKIVRIYAGDPELPSELSPLAAPDLGISVGDVITAVNGRPTSGAADLSALLRGQAGRQVLLQITGVDGNGGVKETPRIVTPVAQRRELQLRMNDWRFSRARAVQQAGLGRIGYLHLRAMGAADIADFAREFYAQTDREGLIIDVRFNTGGNIDSWILEKLLRRAWAFWQRRSPDGVPTYENMQQTFQGQVVILINEETYSDGETFAEGFKRLGLGVAIGKQTSGAGVWLSDQNRLIDNGLVRAAESAQIDVDGRFLIEGIGVKPDIEVDNLPRATFMGGDTQLDAAIAQLQKQMAAKPLKRPVPGAYLRPVKTD